MTGSLAAQLGIGSEVVIAFVGAGGKTSLLLGLGSELAAAGDRVVMTTTTKMGRDEIPSWSSPCLTITAAGTAMDRGTPAFLADSIEDGKVSGVSLDLVDQLCESVRPDRLLVEADGARGRSFKAPEDHEPVIPRTAGVVVVVAGLDAIGRPIGAAAHRPELVAALVGRDQNEPVRPQDVARVVSDPMGGCKRVPATARVVVALTHAVPGTEADARAISELLVGTRVDRVAVIDLGSGVPRS